MTSTCSAAQPCPAPYTCDPIGHYCFIEPRLLRDAGVFAGDANDLRDRAHRDAARTEASLDGTADRPDTGDGGAADRAGGDGAAGDGAAHDAGVVGLDAACALDARLCGEDACAPWQSSGPSGASVRRIEIDPANPDRVFMVADRMIFRSDDGARSWRRMADVGWPEELLVTTEEPPGLILASEFNFQKSGDDGETWYAPAGSGGIRYTQTLRRAPSEPATIFAVTLNRGIYRSLDHGESWQQVKPTSGCNTDHRQALAVDPNDANNVSVVDWTRLWVSEDRGDTWLDRGQVSCNYSVGVDAWNPEIVFLGSYNTGFQVSLDRGLSWAYTSVNGQTITGVLSHPAWPEQTVLISVRDRGVLISADRGHTWDELDNGLGHLGTDAPVRVAPSDPDRLYAATVKGVYRSDDRGQSWRYASRGLPRLPCKQVLVPPPWPATVLAACDDAGVFLSQDRGSSWEALNTGVRAYAPAGAGIALGGAGALTYFASGGALYVLEQGASRWQRREAPGAISTLAAADTSAETVYLGMSAGGVHASGDAGQSWHPLGGLGFAPAALAVSPQDPDLVLAGGAATGLWRGPQGNGVWTQLFVETAASLTVRHILFDPTQPTRFYLASDQGLLRGDLAGVRPALQRLWEPDLPLRAVALCPCQPGALFAAGDFGLQASEDAGQTWRPVDEGLSAVQIRAIATGGAGCTLYAATDKGVWSRRLD